MLELTKQQFLGVADYLAYEPHVLPIGIAIFFRRVWMLGSPARAKTSVSGILSCHFIASSFLRCVVWKVEVEFSCMALVDCPGF